MSANCPPGGSMSDPTPTQLAADVGLARLCEIVRGRKTDGFDLFTISGDELTAVDEYRAALVARITDLEAGLKRMDSEYQEAELICHQQATRITALEAQLADAADHLGDLVAFGEATARARAAEAQVAALTQERDAATDLANHYARTTEGYADRARAAEAALATTRQALTEIRDGYDGDEFEDSADAAERFRDIARRALAAATDTNKEPAPDRFFGRGHCECERRKLPEDAECLYDEPCLRAAS